MKVICPCTKVIDGIYTTERKKSLPTRTSGRDSNICILALYKHLYSEIWNTYNFVFHVNRNCSSVFMKVALSVIVGFFIL